jgi:DNA-binding IclR family transcriptional regulator
MTSIRQHKQPLHRQAHDERGGPVERALEILSLFDEEHLVISPHDISDHLHLSRSATYRYLQTLQQFGYLHDAGRGQGFGVGPRVHELARLGRQSLSISDLALPVMNRLADRLDETVLFSRLIGAHVVCLERIQSSQPIRLSYERGQVRPINAGASAKILLAWLEESVVDNLIAAEPLRAVTPLTLTEVEPFKRDLGRIREDGFSISRGESDDGVLGVAAPIHNARNEVIGGLSVAAPEYRVAADRIREITEMVIAAAGEVSAAVQAMLL